MAGIWQPWTDQETGEMIETFAIVTTAANALMSEVHNKKQRMPLMLDEDHAEAWIREDLREDEIRGLVTWQYPSAGMHAQTIRKDFREAMDPTEPFNYPELPPLAH
jgi:putative SOS response-associated peptidase YedK